MKQIATLHLKHSRTHLFSENGWNFHRGHFSPSTKYNFKTLFYIIFSIPSDKDINQDAYTYRVSSDELNQSSIFVVADGVSSSTASQVASDFTTRQFAKLFNIAPEQWTVKTRAETIASARSHCMASNRALQRLITHRSTYRPHIPVRIDNYPLSVRTILKATALA